VDKPVTPPEPTEPARFLTRRRFLQLLAGGAVAGSGVLAYTCLVEPHWFQVLTRPMPITGLPDSLVGRTLLQLSDLHIGDRVDPDYLVRALKAAAKLRPDIVAVTGDITQDASASRRGDMAAILRHLPLGALGTVAILGNHDYGPNWSHPKLADGVASVLADAGAMVLRNGKTEIAGLQVVGIDDFWTDAFDGHAAMRLMDHDRPGLVLCHNPDVCDLDIWGGYAGWILSGHTHGGQCKPPFLPPPLLPVMNRRYTRGAFDVGGGRRLFISAGLGYLRRVRFNVRPDMVLFRLERAG
jgi:predicted MPP superfamily phosphohydrolase